MMEALFWISVGILIGNIAGMCWYLGKPGMCVLCIFASVPIVSEFDTLKRKVNAIDTIRNEIVQERKESN